MAKCILCQSQIRTSLSLDWLLSFEPLKEARLCLTCQKSFERLMGPTCPGCGKKDSASLCLDCQKWQANISGPLLKNKALYCYKNQAMREYFDSYKFQGDYYLRYAFKAEFEDYLQENFPKKDWLYEVIPVDEQTLKTRGFNQVCGLVEDLDYRLDLALWQKFGRKKQSHKSRQERLASPQPFVYQGPGLENKRILLIDDIYTTGRTLYYARDLMVKAGAKEVRSVTLCR